MKLPITLMSICLTISAFAKGLYLISGGDFRTSPIQYRLITTEDNQQVEITPNYVFLLKNYGNDGYTGPWSVKSSGYEYLYGEYDNIHSKTSSGGCTNAEPRLYTYPKSGFHTVKVYDPKGNIYQIGFTNNNNIVDLMINWENIPTTDKFRNSFGCYIRMCDNLKNIYLGLPEITKTDASARRLNYMFSYMPKLENFNITHPESYTHIEYSFVSNYLMTNDVLFVNVTNVIGSFSNNYRIQNASFPNVEYIGNSVFNISDLSNSDKINYPDWGLKTLTISDKIKKIGLNTFWKQTRMETIYFITDSDDWVSTWNSIIPLIKVFGNATVDSKNPEQATLQLVGIEDLDTSYFSPLTDGVLSLRANPKKVIRIRKTN